MKTIQLGAPVATAIPNNFRIDLPPEIGQGGVDINCFVSGLQLRVVTTRFEEMTVLQSRSSAGGAVTGFGFCLEGYFESRSDCAKGLVLCKPNLSGFFSCPEVMDVAMMVDCQPMRYGVIVMPHETLNVLARNDEEHLAPIIEKLDICVPGLLSDVLTPAMRMAFHQILCCPYVGLIRELFLESKVMELLALKLEQLRFGYVSDCRNSVTVKTADIERIRYAAEILTRDLENSPDTTQLAHAVGMGRSKFYQCFRDVYGLSPFEYLREQRLEKARYLLQEGAVNVTEAALCAGYGHLSYFAKAFKAMYGVSPKEYLDSARY